MCIDNLTTKPDPQAITALQNEEIGAYVQREIFASPKWAELRRRYPGISERELLKAAVLQAEFIVYLDIQPRLPVVFQATEYKEAMLLRASGLVDKLQPDAVITDQELYDLAALYALSITQMNDKIQQAHTLAAIFMLGYRAAQKHYR